MHQIKRYSNRKLYDATDRHPVTLDGIAELVHAGQDIKVTDNETGEDITTVILSEILLDRERQSAGPLSKSILTSLVRTGTSTFEQVRKTLTSNSLVQLAEQEFERVLNTWIELGHMTEQEAVRTLETMIERRRMQRGELPAGTQDAVAEAPAASRIPTREEFDRLAAQVHGLKVQIGNLTEELRAKG